MGIHIMLRKCEHCSHEYTYNPSVGKFGFICPKCHKIQSKLIAVPSNRKVKNFHRK